MNYSSCLNDNHATLVIDTSVLINLHACGYGERILSAVPNGIIVPQIVADELRSDRNGEQGFLNRLVDSKIISLADLTEDEYVLFLELTAGVTSVDDGEAATIALAASRNFFPLIDDKKGRSLASARMGSLNPAWSLDLFCHTGVTSELGERESIEALYLALRDGRMRIPVESADHVITLIGIERAKECTCLPGYRERFQTQKG